MGLYERLKKIILFLENPAIPFSNYILIFFSCVSLRNFFEIFSDQAKISFKLFPYQNLLYFLSWKGLSISLLHYYAYWLALFLAIAIIFSLITKEENIKIIKILFCFSFVLWITPLADLLISAGKGIDIRYAYPKNFLEFFPFPNCLTPGMVITSSIAMILSFIYCRIKTKSLVKSFLGALSTYLLLLVTSVLPLILKTMHPVPIIRALVLAIVSELLLISISTKKTFILALFKDIRMPRLLHFNLMFILGIFLAKPGLKDLFKSEILSFFLSLLAISLSWITTIILNNLEDLSIDKISNPDRPLVTQEIPRDIYKRISLFCFFCATTCALAINFATFFFVILLLASGIIYSLPPLRFKRIPLFSKLFISFNSLLLIMLGYIFSGKELLNFPSVINWYFLVFITLCLNFIDLKDLEGDKQAGILTLPVILGLKKAKLLIGGFFLITYAMLGLVFLDTRLFVPGIILGMIQFSLVNKKAYSEKWIFLTHLIAICMLIAYLNFVPI